MNMVKVFGHLSPDTDATCSAITWAWYLNEHTNHDATPYVLGGLNSETSFVLSRFGFSVPELLPELSAGEDVVIVDTNNPQELPGNILEANIIQLIDHHKLVGGLMTETPIDITIRPLACTATIQYDLMMNAGVTIPANIAGLMLSAILSDTLGFRSPTTTSHDIEVAEKLATIVGIDHLAYASEMFAAKSDISGFTDLELIKLDSKKYEVGDKNFRVSVVETTTPNTVLDRTEGLVAAMKACVSEESDIDDVLLFVIDILNEEAIVFTYNDLTKQVITASFGVPATSDTVVLPGIVSRKKQIVPALKL